MDDPSYVTFYTEGTGVKGHPVRKIICRNVDHDDREVKVKREGRDAEIIMNGSK